MFDYFKNLFKKERSLKPDLLENCIQEKILTREEVLRIKKDRAIAEWEKEIEDLKLKKKKK